MRTLKSIFPLVHSAIVIITDGVDIMIDETSHKVVVNDIDLCKI